MIIDFEYCSSSISMQYAVSGLSTKSKAVSKVGIGGSLLPLHRLARVLSTNKQHELKRLFSQAFLLLPWHLSRILIQATIYV